MKSPQLITGAISDGEKRRRMTMALGWPLSARSLAISIPGCFMFLMRLPVRLLEHMEALMGAMQLPASVVTTSPGERIDLQTVRERLIQEIHRKSKLLKNAPKLPISMRGQ
jgi:hypothetical protein